VSVFAQAGPQHSRPLWVGCRCGTRRERRDQRRTTPRDPVRRRLFHWSPVEPDVHAVTIDDTGVETYTDDTRKAIVRPDTGAILGIFRTGYKVHDYDQWLINNVEGILDADLHIGSAGLLREGAVAWVQVEMADTLNAAGPQGDRDRRPIESGLTAGSQRPGALPERGSAPVEVGALARSAPRDPADVGGPSEEKVDARYTLGEVDATHAGWLFAETWDSFWTGRAPCYPGRHIANRLEGEGLPTLGKSDRRLYGGTGPRIIALT
jgi:hypothetical protein